MPAAAVALMAFAIPWLQIVVTQSSDYPAWRHAEPTLAMYTLVAATCVFLAWWGVRQSSKAVVNYGIAAFALSVMWFYSADRGDGPCNRARLTKTVEYFIADTAKTPFPLKTGEELWVEVTMPPMGPPRPIQLALSKDGIFTPLKLK